jgi:hypothetical protein
VKAVVRCGLPERLRDLDNVTKSLFDLCQAHGIIADDAAVVDFACRWDKVVPTGRIHLQMWTTRHPVARSDAEGRKRSGDAAKRTFDRAFGRGAAA